MTSAVRLSVSDAVRTSISGECSGSFPGVRLADARLLDSQRLEVRGPDIGDKGGGEAAVCS